MSTRITFQLLVTGPAEKHGFYEIPVGITLIGRQPTVALQGEQPRILVLNQQKISSNHAQIECDGQECMLTDLHSQNGTFLMGIRIKPQVAYHLPVGAEVKIGDFTLVLEQISGEVPKPEAPGQNVYWRAGSETGGVEQPPEPPDAPVAPTETSSPSGGDDFPKAMFSTSRLLINFLPEIYHDKEMESFLGLFESILLPVIWNIENFDLYLSYKTAPSFFLPWLAQWFGLVLNDTWSEKQRRELLQDAHMLFAKRGTPWALGRLLEIYTGKEIYIRQNPDPKNPDNAWAHLDSVWHSFIDTPQTDPLIDNGSTVFVNDADMRTKRYSYIDDTPKDPYFPIKGVQKKPYFFIVHLRGMPHRRKEEAEERYKLIKQLIMENMPAHTSFMLEIEE